MPRPALELGSYGEIGTKYNEKTGKWRAWATYRHLTGKRQTVEATADTEAKAKSALRKKLKAVADQGAATKADNRLTLNSKFTTALDLWIEEKRADPNVSDDTLAGYLKEIETAKGPRASKATIRIRKSLGDMYLREMDTGVFDDHLKSITGLGLLKKAKTHRIILTGVMSMVVRRTSLQHNPLKEVDKSRMRGGRGKRERPKAASWEILHGLRAQVERWAAGEPVPGVPGRDPRKGGPSRDKRLLDVADLLAGTGVRPWEVLAFRWGDLENYDQRFGVVNPEKPVRLTICGTIVETEGRVYRKPIPKTEAGWRVVVLPGYAVDALDHAANHWRPSPEDLVFPNRKGGCWAPSNFNRTWRDARGHADAGSEYAWISMRVYRKTVLTAIREAGGDARGQAGHTDDRVVDLYYYDKPQEAGDHRAILDGYEKR